MCAFQITPYILYSAILLTTPHRVHYIGNRVPFGTQMVFVLETKSTLIHYREKTDMLNRSNLPDVIRNPVSFRLMVSKAAFTISALYGQRRS